MTNTIVAKTTFLLKKLSFSDKSLSPVNVRGIKRKMYESSSESDQDYMKVVSKKWILNQRKNKN